VSPRHGAVAVAGLLAAVLALTGCGAQPRPAPSATALPSGIVATLLPPGPTQGPGEARVWIVNGTEADLALTRLRIDAPVFEGIGRKAAGGPIEVAAGRSAEIVITLPPIDCAADPRTPIPGAEEHASGATPATSTPAPTPAATDSPEQTTATIGFAVGAAIGVAVEPLDDPHGVIAARAAAACG
jgi:hypothetical protein